MIQIPFLPLPSIYEGGETIEVPHSMNNIVTKLKTATHTQNSFPSSLLEFFLPLLLLLSAQLELSFLSSEKELAAAEK